MSTSRRNKVGLILEILVLYAPLRWRFEKRDPRDLAAASRRPSRWARRQPEGRHETLLLARHLARAVDKTLGVLPTDSRCLIQSLVLCRLLAVRGIASQIVIGARAQPSFAAHAWVEYEGRPVSAVGEFWETRLTEL